MGIRHTQPLELLAMILLILCGIGAIYVICIDYMHTIQQETDQSNVELVEPCIKQAKPRINVVFPLN